MPLRDEAVAIASSAFVVAVAAIPLGFSCGWIARQFQEPIIPRYRKNFSRWLVFDIVMMAILCLILNDAMRQILQPTGLFELLIGGDPPPSHPATMAVIGGISQPTVESLQFQHRFQRLTVVGLLMMPCVMLAFQFWKRAMPAERVPPIRESLKRIIADVAAGVWVWLLIAPLTFAIHFAVNAITEHLQMPPDDHPLKRLPMRTSQDVILLFLGACVVAPFFEEMAYRRLLIPWAVQKQRHSWILLAMAGFVAVSLNGGSSRTGPIGFVAVMASAVGILHWRTQANRRLPLRPASAIISTATLFAVMHSAVWPTPIPLVVLGMALGWLVLRTKTATAAMVTHGLFNAISACYMLRGGA